MRSSLVVLVVFLSLAPAARCQSLAIKGVSVALGESEAKAQADLAGRGLKLNAMTDPDSFIVTGQDSNSRYEIYGEIAFIRSKVSFVSRSRLPNPLPNDTQADLIIFNSVLSSLLEGEKDGRCTITQQSKDNSPSAGLIKLSHIECPKATDCSSGCSMGGVAPSFNESIKQNGTR